MAFSSDLNREYSRQMEQMMQRQAMQQNAMYNPYGNLGQLGTASIHNKLLLLIEE